nr:hypothetical protein [Tanacetum cinerariifolium]
MLGQKRLELPIVWWREVQERNHQKAEGMVVRFLQPISGVPNFKAMFRLELRVFDETAHVVVVMFDETASKLIHSAETAKESAGSSTIDAITNPQTSLGKRLCKHPSVSTLLKPSEEKKSKREDLEDSDAELSPFLAEGVQDDKAGDHSDRKKKKRIMEQAD